VFFYSAGSPYLQSGVWVGSSWTTSLTLAMDRSGVFWRSGPGRAGGGLVCVAPTWTAGARMEVARWWLSRWQLGRGSDVVQPRKSYSGVARPRSSIRRPEGVWNRSV
jgi:hypothetical protein